MELRARYHTLREVLLSASIVQTRDKLIVAYLQYFPDLLANLLELLETVTVPSLGHGDRLLYNFHLPFLVVQILVQLCLQVEVGSAQKARKVTEARNRECERDGLHFRIV